jgi:predicted AlkP superfamily phosphohydrolase/phosphomutase
LKPIVLWPLLAYPTWDINGLFIGRSTIKDKISQSITKSIEDNPDSIINEKIITNLTHKRREHPWSKRKFQSYLTDKVKLVNFEFDYALQLSKKYDSNFLFVYSSICDTVQHHFWDECDVNSPFYNPESKYKNTIRDIYMLYDIQIKKILDQIDIKNTKLYILSDHGMQRRPTKIININELLRRNGFLFTQKNIKTTLKSKNRKLILQIITKLELGDLAAKLLNLFPSLKKGYVKPDIIDYSKTLAAVSDNSGIKSYPYGGITLNKKLIKSEEIDRNELIINIIDLLKEFSERNNNIILDIKKREELGKGTYINSLPDIIFILRKEYGAGWETHTNLITKKDEKNLVPGTHDYTSACFIGLENGIKLEDINIKNFYDINKYLRLVIKSNK